VTLATPPFQRFVTRCVWTVTGNVHVKNEVRSSNTTDRMRHNIRGVKLTPASRRRYKIGLPVEGLKENFTVHSILFFQRAKHCTVTVKLQLVESLCTICSTASVVWPCLNIRYSNYVFVTMMPLERSSTIFSFKRCESVKELQLNCGFFFSGTRCS